VQVVNAPGPVLVSVTIPLGADLVPDADVSVTVTVQIVG
jgi:hypothetical protein